MTTQQPPTATGRRETRDGAEWLVLERTFRAPVEDVWSAVTESERLARWYGSWEGDPATGQVTVHMLYEGDDATPEVFTIHTCEPPRHLHVSSLAPAEEGGPALSWHVRIDLSESAGTTTLVFAQSVPDPGLADSMGPGWEYYLDRLVAAESGGDPGALDFGDYYPSLSGPYREAFGLD